MSWALLVYGHQCRTCGAVYVERWRHVKTRKHKRWVAIQAERAARSLEKGTKP